MFYARRAGGITSSANYPYTAREGTCKDSLYAGVSNISSVWQATPKSQAALLYAIDQGPAAITLDASSSTFQRYTSGIVNTRKCGTSLNHAVVAVGYGTWDKGYYYIVRNSWGTAWGNRGYINIAASGEGKIGVCGIQSYTYFPEMV